MNVQYINVFDEYKLFYDIFDPRGLLGGHEVEISMFVLGVKIILIHVIPSGVHELQETPSHNLLGTPLKVQVRA